MATVAERIFDRIDFDADNGHWMWLGQVWPNSGYSKFGIDSAKSVIVHRWMWEYEFGEMPEGLVYRHSKGCPKLCVNPYHAREPGTHSENSLDVVVDGNHHNVNKTHCPYGHEYTEDNLSAGNRGRKCKRCDRRSHYLVRHPEMSITMYEEEFSTYGYIRG